ncbi:hypothetical protein SAMN05720354_104145 [Nitrosospira sp. Nsp1]|nr:hypothetical protein SAMN05720354_104145 [Nitrosospira sp. Nsp1]
MSKYGHSNYSNPQAQPGAPRQYYIARYFSLNFHSLQPIFSEMNHFLFLMRVSAQIPTQNSSKICAFKA